MSTYSPSVPTGTVPLDQDYKNLQLNFSQADISFGVDHLKFSNNTPQNGYHTVIHEVPFGTWNPASPGTGLPTNIAGYNQIIAMNWTPDFATATADTQLFALTGNGGKSQLTGSSVQTDGWQWVGGILIQWGIVPPPAASSGSFSGGNANGSVTYQNRGPASQGIPFPNNCFVVIATPFWTTTAPSGEASVNIQRSATAPFYPITGFTYQMNSNSSQYTGFNWIAIGN